MMERNFYAEEALEPYYAQLFIEFINQQYGLDYEYQDPIKQDDSVDAFAISKIGRPTLQLQEVLAEGGIFKIRAQNEKNFFSEKNLKAFEFNPRNDWKQWIISAIQAKLNENYSNAQNLILLIQGHSPTPKREEVERCFRYQCEHIPFKGVYYVVPEQTIYPKGYIAIIKDGFNIHLR